MTPSPFSLSNKVCVIIGGAGTLGKAFSKACAEAGATVVVAEIDAARGEAVAAEINNAGGVAAYFHCDATDPKSIHALVEEVKKKFGHIDGVANASHHPSTTSQGATNFNDVSYETFAEGLVAHAGSSFLSAREFGKVMEEQKSGSIVLVGSMYGHFAPRFEMYEGLGMTQPAEYVIAKGGLTQFTAYLAKYIGPKGVRVNMLSPGGIIGSQPEEFKKRFNKHALLEGRMLTPEEVAPTLVFLFSDASSHMTGQNLAVDGGWTL